MIYHAKVFEKIETVTKIKYEEKMRDMKKINKANMCDIICWVEIPRLMSICETFQ